MSVRLLLDENLSERLISALEPKFAGARHVRPIALGGASDLAIWAHAIEHGFVLVTKDEDFIALSVLRGAPPKVIWLNIGNAGNADTAALLLRHADAIERFTEHADAGFLALGFGPRSS